MAQGVLANAIISAEGSSDGGEPLPLSTTPMKTSGTDSIKVEHVRELNRYTIFTVDPM